MALKAILASLDGVSEALRGEYTEKDGKFYLQVDAVDGYALEDITGLRNALSTERSTRQSLEATVVKFKDLDPDKAREALTKLAEFESLDPAKEADKIANTKFEAAKRQLLESHQNELGQRDTRIKGLATTVDGLIREQKATAAIAAHKGSVELLLPHVLSNTRSVEDANGKWSVEVIKPGADGNPVVQVNSKGENMSIEEFVASMRENAVYARAFEGDGQTGSDKQPSDGDKRPPGGGDFGGDRTARTNAIAKRFNLPTA